VFLYRVEKQKARLAFEREQTTLEVLCRVLLAAERVWVQLLVLTRLMHAASL